MSQERTGLVTLKGNPVTLLGPEVKVGDPAPEFAVCDGALQPVTLGSSKGKTRIICTVPSLDTPVCQIEAKKFNEKAAALPDGIITYIVSLDMPFAQKRFCTQEKADKIVPLSDFRNHSFAHNWGVQIKETGFYARAVFVVGADDKVKHIEIVKEVAQEPDYEKALAAAK
ncbi:thiol peroxidase [Candidatus Sumerlaeota bacterium]|nr:thiol peroxidase [Candidatus Sumerlaeota bacterium]